MRNGRGGLEKGTEQVELSEVSQLRGGRVLRGPGY